MAAFSVDLIGCVFVTAISRAAESSSLNFQIKLPSSSFPASRPVYRIVHHCTIASLEAELANAESLKERIEDGETLEGILSEISAEPYTATVEVDDQVTEGVENAEQALDGINGKTVNTYIKVTTVPGGGDIDGSHAGGLDRVPFDGYIAQLHAGEAVLTRSEASLWRAEKAASLVGGGMLGDAGASFQQVNNFNVPVQTPDEFAKTMRLYATYGLEGVI